MVVFNPFPTLAISLIRLDWVPAIANLDRDRLAVVQAVWAVMPLSLDTMIANAQMRRRAYRLTSPQSSEKPEEHVARVLAHPSAALPAEAGVTGPVAPSLTPVPSGQEVASVVARRPQVDTVSTRSSTHGPTVAYPFPHLRDENLPDALAHLPTVSQRPPIGQGGGLMALPRSLPGAASFPDLGDHEMARPISYRPVHSRQVQASMDVSCLGGPNCDDLSGPTSPVALCDTMARSAPTGRESAPVPDPLQGVPNVEGPALRTRRRAATRPVYSPSYEEDWLDDDDEVDAPPPLIQPRSRSRVVREPKPLPEDDDGDDDGNAQVVGDARYHKWHKYCGPPLPITVDGGGEDPKAIIQNSIYLCSLCATKVSSQALLSRHFVLHKVGSLQCPFRRGRQGGQWQNCGVKFHRWHVLRILPHFRANSLLTFS